MDIEWTGVNWLAVVVAAVANMALGFAWYSRAVFGTRWAKLAGVNIEQMSGRPSPMYAITVVAALVGAYVTALFVQGLGASTVLEGALVGGLAWLGFIVPATVVDYMFVGRPRDLWVVNNGYQLVAFVLMGAILGFWQ
jgi:uncharacterized protein DUF1761